MRSDYGDQLVAFQKVTGVFATEEDRAVALVVCHVRLVVVDASVLLLDGVGPYQIAEGTVERDFYETV